MVILLMVAAFVVGCEKEPKPAEPSQMEVNPEFVPIDWEETSVQR